jgi:hypothetical protein
MYMNWKASETGWQTDGNGGEPKRLTYKGDKTHEHEKLRPGNEGECEHKHDNDRNKAAYPPSLHKCRITCTHLTLSHCHLAPSTQNEALVASRNKPKQVGSAMNEVGWQQ